MKGIMIVLMALFIVSCHQSVPTSDPPEDPTPAAFSINVTNCDSPYIFNNYQIWFHCRNRSRDNGGYDYPISDTAGINGSKWLLSGLRLYSATNNSPTAVVYSKIENEGIYFKYLRITPSIAFNGSSYNGIITCDVVDALPSGAVEQGSSGEDSVDWFSENPSPAVFYITVTACRQPYVFNYFQIWFHSQDAVDNGGYDRCIYETAAINGSNWYLTDTILYSTTNNDPAAVVYTKILNNFSFYKYLRITPSINFDGSAYNGIIICDTVDTLPVGAMAQGSSGQYCVRWYK